MKLDDFFDTIERPFRNYVENMMNDNHLLIINTALAVAALIGIFILIQELH